MNLEDSRGRVFESQLKLTSSWLVVHLLRCIHLCPYLWSKSLPEPYLQLRCQEVRPYVLRMQPFFSLYVLTIGSDPFFSSAFPFEISKLQPQFRLMLSFSPTARYQTTPDKKRLPGYTNSFSHERNIREFVQLHHIFSHLHLVCSLLRARPGKILNLYLFLRFRNSLLPWPHFPPLGRRNREVTIAPRPLLFLLHLCIA